MEEGPKLIQESDYSDSVENPTELPRIKHFEDEIDNPKAISDTAVVEISKIRQNVLNFHHISDRYDHDGTDQHTKARMANYKDFSEYNADAVLLHLFDGGKLRAGEALQLKGRNDLLSLIYKGDLTGDQALQLKGRDDLISMIENGEITGSDALYIKKNEELGAARTAERKSQHGINKNSSRNVKEKRLTPDQCLQRDIEAARKSEREYRESHPDPEDQEEQQ